MNTNNTPTSAQQTTDADDHVALLEWTAARTSHQERSPRWYRIGAMVVLGAAAYGILTGAWSLSILTVLIGGLYYLSRKELPGLHSIRIERSGFLYDGLFVHWGDVSDTWFVQTAHGPELHIRRKSGSPREFVLLADHIDQTLIRSTVSRFTTFSSDRHEQLLDVLIRLCKL